MVNKFEALILTGRNYHRPPGIHAAAMIALMLAGGVCIWPAAAFSQLAISYADVEEEAPSADGDSADGYAVVDGDASAADQTLVSSRQGGLIASLTIFVLAIFVGFEVITKVPPTLHTPLMSGSNAISGITVVGALIAAGASEMGLAAVLGMIAVVLATINVAGGFMVTHRMLSMFKSRKR